MMKVLQEAEETSLAAHVAICRERSRDILIDVGFSPAHSTGTPRVLQWYALPWVIRPQRMKLKNPRQGTTLRRIIHILMITQTILRILEKLAVIQGRLSFTSPPQSRGRHLNNNRNGNRHQGDTRTTGTITSHLWRGRLASNPHGNPNPNRQQNMNHHANINRFNHPRFHEAVIVAIDKHATIIP